MTPVGDRRTSYAGRVTEPVRRTRNVRWGLLSLLFLGIALASVLVSSSHGSYTGTTFAGLVLGFAGAGLCSYKGLKGVSWLPR